MTPFLLVYGRRMRLEELPRDFSGFNVRDSDRFVSRAAEEQIVLELQLRIFVNFELFLVLVRLVVVLVEVDDAFNVVRRGASYTWSQ